MFSSSSSSYANTFLSNGRLVERCLARAPTSVTLCDFFTLHSLTWRVSEQNRPTSTFTAFITHICVLLDHCRLVMIGIIYIVFKENEVITVLDQLLSVCTYVCMYVCKIILCPLSPRFSFVLKSSLYRPCSTCICGRTIVFRLSFFMIYP
jgi:hypothetical protein